jgi:hypothetical protein
VFAFDNTREKIVLEYVFEFEVQTSFPIDAEEQQQTIYDLTLSNAERPVDAETEPKRFSVRFPDFFKQNIRN